MIDSWPNDEEMCELCGCGHTLGQHEYGSERSPCDQCRCNGFHPVCVVYVAHPVCIYGHPVDDSSDIIIRGQENPMAEDPEPVNPTGTLKEGLSEQDVRPDPKVWPECTAPDCGVAYILRHGWQFQGGQLNEGWFWQRDCKHKKAPAKMVGPGMAEDDGG